MHGGTFTARLIRAGVFHVGGVERAGVRPNPVPLFTTASLQQEVSHRLGFGMRKTMRLARCAAVFFGSRVELADAMGRKVGLIRMATIRNPFCLASVERDRENVYVVPA